jgi:hypothetical protein
MVILDLAFLMVIFYIMDSNIPFRYYPMKLLLFLNIILFYSVPAFSQHSMIVMPDMSKVPTLEEMNNPHPEMNTPTPTPELSEKKESVRKEVRDLDNIKIHSKLYDETSKDYQCVDVGPNMELEDVCKKWEPKQK